MEVGLIIIIVLFGAFWSFLLIWGIGHIYKTYLVKIGKKRKTRTQPLTSATLSKGDALLFKEKWKWPLSLEPSDVYVYYEVMERTPTTIIFARKDKSEKELMYPYVDELIAKGMIIDY